MKQYCALAFYINIIIGIDANTYTNPILKSGPDPWMLYYEGYYYLAHSTFNDKITMLKSKTIDGFHTAKEELIYTMNGTHTLWAPEFHLHDGHWYLYYTAGTDAKNIGTQRLHVLESSGTDPMGPYHFKADLRDPTEDGMELDPSFIKIDGKLYLLGSYFKNGLQDLFIRPMSTPWQPSGKKVLLTSPLLAWERQGGTTCEGPEPLQHNGRNFIVYSASSCQTPDYKLGMLTLNGTDPLNASHWHKSGPVFERNDADHVYGPGHNGFFMSPDGKENWIVYHANDALSGKCGMGRSTRVQKFTWNQDGTPNFGKPVAAGVKFEAPSGETSL